ncbi:MAG TPA: DUF4386 domain-containing protein [Cyclobacteriaceae bacterium]|nr:DUF4386 domain-containing protein [Cyclobacteriaceae bacterium]
MKTNIQSSMSPLRKTSLLAGAIYLLTFVSIPTLALYNPLRGSGPEGSGNGVIIGALLEIIVGLAGIGTAIVLFPVLKKQNETLALGLVAARILEAATIFVGVAFIVTAVTLQQGGSDRSLVSALVLMYDKIFLVGQSLMPALDDLLLGILLYRSGLVPKFLAWIGIVGAFVLVAGDIGVFSGMLEQRAPLTALFAIPVAVFEFSLGLLLVFKGFRTSGRTQANTETAEDAERRKEY